MSLHEIVLGMNCTILASLELIDSSGAMASQIVDNKGVRAVVVEVDQVDDLRLSLRPIELMT